MMKKYKYLRDTVVNKKGDVVQLQDGFWTKYYTTKGILQPVEQLQVQDKPKTKKSRPAKRKKEDE